MSSEKHFSPETTPSVVSPAAAIASTTNGELFSEIELAHHLGVTVRCVQAWRLQRWGPKYVKVGRLVRYQRADVLAFLARQLIDTNECRDVALARRRRGRRPAG